MNASRSSSGGSAGWILLTLWLVVFSSSSQVMIIAPILPDISKELGFVTNSLLGALTALLAAGLVWRYLPETLPAGPQAAPTQTDACNILGAPDALCGPCPEAGHMARSLQEACAEKARLQA